MQAELEFWVEMGLVTRVMLDYRTDRGEHVRPELVQFTDTYDTWSTRMRDPARTVFDGNDLWQFNLVDEGTMQRFLTTLDSSVAELIALTQRPALIEALRHPAPGAQTAPPGASPSLADQGRSPELDRLMGELTEPAKTRTWCSDRSEPPGTDAAHSVVSSSHERPWRAVG